MVEVVSPEGADSRAEEALLEEAAHPVAGKTLVFLCYCTGPHPHPPKHLLPLVVLAALP